MYAILDIETTGGKYNEEGITEIAIHKFDGHKVVDTFISLVNPEKEIQPFVANLTGINNKMLRTAPKFHEVAKRIVEITEDTVLVAHNAQFDYRILRTEFRRLGFNFERKTLCTVDLSKNLLPEADSYSLGKLVRSLGIPVSDRHRANGDALATLQLFKLLLNKDLDKSIMKGIIREESLGELSPRQLDIVEQLPSETGLYYMYNKEGEIIFLGKSKNLKKRVNQHFTRSGETARKIQKETKKVTFERTGNELIAILKEQEELGRNRPKYNLNYQQQLFSHALYKSVSTKGYFTLRPDRLNGTSGRITTFASLEGAVNLLSKINDEFQLCDKLNAIPDARCSCVKTNAEDCLQHTEVTWYNHRVEQAIEKYSLSQKNSVLIDKGREVGEHSAILIQNGMFKGLGFYNLNHQINNIHILESIITPMKGNINTTHIIESYLRKRKVLKILDLDH
ncbi:exonuclease domain-containing protein [Spongiimicrobium sp. 2-473A-2-J]|uniref:exonuclease domain-containing protein n=1 Tax=Eudoraea algarum TaxID=3417568 RepID=UPI003D362754